MCIRDSSEQTLSALTRELAEHKATIEAQSIALGKADLSLSAAREGSGAAAAAVERSAAREEALRSELAAFRAQAGDVARKLEAEIGGLRERVAAAELAAAGFKEEAETTAEALAAAEAAAAAAAAACLLYTSPSPRDQRGSRMPSSA